MIASISVALLALLLGLETFADAGILNRLRRTPTTQQVLDTSGSPLQGFKDAEKPWNIMYHMGGNSPWIPKLSGIVDGGIEPSAGCRVEQVHMVGGHRKRAWWVYF